MSENVVKASELSGRSDAELTKLMHEKRDDLYKAKFKKALGQLAKTHTLRQLRRDVARIQTVLSHRSKAAAGE